MWQHVLFILQKLKPEPLPLPTKITSILPKHEPISPVEDTPVRFPHLAFSSTTAPPPPSGYRPPGMPAAPVVGRTTAPGTNSRPHRGDMDSITSLPFSIPLHKLRRNPAITPLRSIKAEKHMVRLKYSTCHSHTIPQCICSLELPGRSDNGHVLSLPHNPTIHL